MFTRKLSFSLVVVKIEKLLCLYRGRHAVKNLNAHVHSLFWSGDRSHDTMTNKTGNVDRYIYLLKQRSCVVFIKFYLFG